MRKACIVLLTAILAASCGGGPDMAEDEVEIRTSDKARDILGWNLQLFALKDRRESTGLKAWSFRLRNDEDEVVAVRAVPEFISEDGRTLGGKAYAEEAQLPPGQEREFYFKAPTGEAVRLIVRFERGN
jgi:hypothetical protein